MKKKWYWDTCKTLLGLCSASFFLFFAQNASAQEPIPATVGQARSGSEAGYLSSCTDNCTTKYTWTPFIFSDPVNDLVLEEALIPLQRGNFNLPATGIVTLTFSTSSDHIEDIGNLSASTTWHTVATVNCTPDYEYAVATSYPISGANEFAEASGEWIDYSCDLSGTALQAGYSLLFSFGITGDTKQKWNYFRSTDDVFDPYFRAYNGLSGEALPNERTPSIRIFGYYQDFLDALEDGSAFGSYSSSTFGFEDPDFGTFGNAMIEIAKYLFVPSDASKAYLDSARADMALRVPLGYFSAVSSTIASMSDYGGTSTSTLTIYATTTSVDEEVALFSMADIENRIPESIRNNIHALGGIAVWAVFFMWIVAVATQSPWKSLGIRTPDNDDDNVICMPDEVADVYTADETGNLHYDGEEPI